MSKISGEMLADIKHGIETGEDKNGIKVDGLAYTWKELEPLYQYIQTIQNEYKTLQKRNSRQRLANKKQYELILKLQREIEHKDKLIDIANAGIENLQQENERLKKNQRLSPEERQHFHLDIDEIYEILIDYKSRCEKINNILNEFPDFNYSNDYMILKRKIEEALQGSDDNE